MALVEIDIKDRDGNSVGKSCTVNLDERLSSKENPNFRLFKGHFKHTKFPGIVAKIYTNNDTEDEPKSNFTVCFERARENLEFLSLPGNKHPNLITYYGHEIIGKKTYLITELCICSVYKLVINRQAILIGDHTKMLEAFPFKNILQQSTMAVNFLHGLGLVHRNLHPNNFLIQLISQEKDGSNKYAVKLTDFELAKDWEKNPNYSNQYPMDGWRAVPECNPQKTDKRVRDSKSDVFTLGCYFFFVLSGGGHPFGKEGDSSIYNEESPPYKDAWKPLKKSGENWASNVKTEDEAKKALNLIWHMIRHHPSDRKSMWEVLDSDYFQQEPSYYQIYDVPDKKPGLCVIVCQEKFHHPQNDMDGMGENCAQLRRTFLRFGFEVLVYQNIEAGQMLHFLQPTNLSATCTNKLDNYCSLVVCILSHGDTTENGEEVVLGVDAVQVAVDPLIRELNNFNCLPLASKPKIFIIFSCRGGQSQIVENQQPSPSSTALAQSSRPVQDIVLVVGSNETKSAMEDFLVLRSTVKDFYSYFMPGVGSSFIEHLCGALVSEYNEKDAQISKEKKKDLVSLYHSYVVPLIGREVIDLRKPDGSTVRQTPESRSTLTKTIRFRPEVPTSDIAFWMTREKQNLAVKYDGLKELDFWEKRKTQLTNRLNDLREEIQSIQVLIGIAIHEKNDKKCSELLTEKCEKENEKARLIIKEQEVLENIRTKKAQVSHP